MKKSIVLPAFASLAMLGLFGCSSETSSSSMTGSVSEEQSTLNNLIRLNTADAQKHLARYRRSVVESWQLSDTMSTASTEVDTTIQNDHFAIEADVQVEDDSAYTIVSAGVDGDSAAWMIQVENGAIAYSWRNQVAGEWLKFKTEKKLEKNTLTNVRMERAGDIVVFVVDGKVIDAFKSDATARVIGSLTIGFDAMEQGRCHCRNGRIEQAILETVDEMENDSTETVDEINSVDVAADTAVVSKDTVVARWIAEWNFNDSTNVGLDATGNKHDAVVGEGTVTAADGIANFDGSSGFSVSYCLVLFSAVTVTAFGVTSSVPLAVASL